MIARAVSLMFVLCSVSAFAENGLTEKPGFFASAGLGFAPIYVDEVTAKKELLAGSTVTAGHTSARIGWVVNSEYAVYALAEHNWFFDTNQYIHRIGILGIGTTYYPPDFYKFNLSAGAGLAGKKVYGGDAETSGWGLTAGIGRPLTDRLMIDMAYNFIALDGEAAEVTGGESEISSSIQFSLSYYWY